MRSRPSHEQGAPPLLPNPGDSPKLKTAEELVEIDLMVEVAPEAAEQIQRRHLREVAAGQSIFEPGDPEASLYVVQSGEIEILRPCDGGERPVDRLGPGEFFGEMSLVLGGERSVKAVATQPTRVLQIDIDTFHAMCMERPEIAVRIIERLAARVLRLEERVGNRALRELGIGVVRELVKAARGDAKQRNTSLRALAERAGMTVLDAHRVLQDLVERGLIRLENDAVRIPDLGALEAYAEAAESH